MVTSQSSRQSNFQQLMLTQKIFMKETLGIRHMRKLIREFLKCGIFPNELERESVQQLSTYIYFFSVAMG